MSKEIFCGTSLKKTFPDLDYFYPNLVCNNKVLCSGLPMFCKYSTLESPYTQIKICERTRWSRKSEYYFTVGHKLPVDFMLTILFCLVAFWKPFVTRDLDLERGWDGHFAHEGDFGISKSTFSRRLRGGWKCENCYKIKGEYT